MLGKNFVILLLQVALAMGATQLDTGCDFTSCPTNDCVNAVIGEMRCVVNAVQAAYNISLEELQNADTEVAAIGESVERLNPSLLTRNSELDACRASFMITESVINQLEDGLEDGLMDIDNLENITEQCRDELEMLDTAVTQTLMSFETDCTPCDLSGVAATAQALGNQADGLLETFNIVQAALPTLETDISTLAGTVSGYQDECITCTSNLQDLSTELDSIDSAITSNDGQITSLDDSRVQSCLLPYLLNVRRADFITSSVADLPNTVTCINAEDPLLGCTNDFQAATDTNTANQAAITEVSSTISSGLVIFGTICVSQLNQLQAEWDRVQALDNACRRAGGTSCSVDGVCYLDMVFATGATHFTASARCTSMGGDQVGPFSDTDGASILSTCITDAADGDYWVKGSDVGGLCPVFRFVNGGTSTSADIDCSSTTVAVFICKLTQF